MVLGLLVVPALRAAEVRFGLGLLALLEVRLVLGVRVVLAVPLVQGVRVGRRFLGGLVLLALRGLLVVLGVLEGRVVLVGMACMVVVSLRRMVVLVEYRACLAYLVYLVCLVYPEVQLVLVGLGAQAGNILRSLAELLPYQQWQRIVCEFCYEHSHVAPTSDGSPLTRCLSQNPCRTSSHGSSAV